MYISRKADKELELWRKEKSHKPLLIRGARQVGKTRTIKEFGKKFKYYIEINFEESPRLKTLFDEELTPELICENLAAIFKTPVLPGDTLLFFDEIQECPKAIASLRFFYEKMPELHIIAAGSLLEFALSEIPTFGVGRIRSLFFFPLSFSEFLIGSGEIQLLKMIEKAGPLNPLNDAIHYKLIELVRKFICLGGMPEVISHYIETRDLLRCQQILDDLIISFRADFAKYRKRVVVSRLKEVFQSVVTQAGQKFVFSKACTQCNLKQAQEALQLLIMAGLVIPVTHTPATGLPMGAGANIKKQKMLLFDTGIFQRLMGLDLSEFLLSSNFNIINKGKLAEQFVGLEIIKSTSMYQPPGLFYWHREAHSSNAEVDYLIQSGQKILPVEVKAGTKGSMQSIFLFMKEKKADKGIRISSENFSTFENIDIYPLYALSNLELNLEL